MDICSEKYSENIGNAKVDVRSLGERRIYFRLEWNENDDDAQKSVSRKHGLLSTKILDECGLEKKKNMSTLSNTRRMMEKTKRSASRNDTKIIAESYDEGQT